MQLSSGLCDLGGIIDETITITITTSLYFCKEAFAFNGKAANIKNWFCIA